MDLNDELSAAQQGRLMPGHPGSDRRSECGDGDLPGQRCRNQATQRAAQHVFAQRRHVCERRPAQIRQVRWILRTLALSSNHGFGRSRVSAIDPTKLVNEFGEYAAED